MIVEHDLPLTTADGVILRANVYRPEDDLPRPALLMRTPYGKDGAPAIHVFEPAEAIARGFIVVIQDVRGRYASDGDWDPYEDEASDGAATVEWTARLPWCNGVVGMYGASYQGVAQLAAASLQPPALRSIAPMMCWLNPDNGQTFRGGALELGKLVRWTLMNLPDRLSRRAADAREARARIDAAERELAELAARSYDHLPLGELPALARHDPGSEVFRYLAAADEGNLLVPRAIRSATLPAIPKLWVGGWFDSFLGDMLAGFQADRARNVPSQLVVGPWSHANRSRYVGDRDFGPSAECVGRDHKPLAEVVLDWFDRTLSADGATPGEPAVRTFQMGSDVWQEADHFPSGQGDRVELYLDPAGRLLDSPGPTGVQYFDADPNSPVPTIGGATVMGPAFPPGPRVQNELLGRDDLLVYVGATLERDVCLADWVGVELWAASSAPCTDFVARLVDIDPQGRHSSVTDGIARCRLTPGGAPRLTPIDLWATHYVFRRGHRIGLHVTSSSFPRWSNNPNTNEPLLTGSGRQTAHQRVYSGVALPSRIRSGRCPGAARDQDG